MNTASLVRRSTYLPRMAPYNATKAAVVALSETLQFELQAEGSHVGVSVLCPSWVRTNISTSDRNRPERFAYTLDTEQMAQAAEYKARRRQQVATLALEPAEVAEQVCEAVKANRFYILTHPAVSPASPRGPSGSSPARTRRNRPNERVMRVGVVFSQAELGFRDLSVGFNRLANPGRPHDEHLAEVIAVKAEIDRLVG